MRHFGYELKEIYSHRLQVVAVTNWLSVQHPQPLGDHLQGDCADVVRSPSPNNHSPTQTDSNCQRFANNCYLINKRRQANSNSYIKVKYANQITIYGGVSEFWIQIYEFQAILVNFCVCRQQQNCHFNRMITVNHYHKETACSSIAR